MTTIPAWTPIPMLTLAPAHLRSPLMATPTVIAPSAPAQSVGIGGALIGTHGHGRRRRRRIGAGSMKRRRKEGFRLRAAYETAAPEYLAMSLRALNDHLKHETS